MKRLHLLLMSIFIPFAILIDILIGDIATGTKRTIKEKLNEHINLWNALWNS